MESKLSFLLHIAIILLAANIGGIISKRFKQPAVLGQILAGLVLGMGIIEKTETISHLAEIGVIFLMFIAGLETDVNELKASGKSSSIIAFGGVLTPFLLVSGGIYLVTNDLLASLFMGVIATATSVSISVQTLREIGQMRSKQGIGILGAAIIDDVVGIILLTIVIGLVKPGTNSSLFLVIGKIVVFFIMTFIVGYIVIKMISKLSNKINTEDTIVVYAIIFCFILAYFSEELGVAAITGAYFAGVVFSMTSCRHKLSHEVSRISSIMFTPVFFVAIGLGVDIQSAINAFGVGIILVILGTLGKVIGCGFGAKISGFGGKEALQIGIGMVPRAEVAIIIANLGVAIEVISRQQLAAVIMMVLITTLITPSMLKWSFAR
ncbi:cation:proton antiporter [Paramaledivibacter caminithermalis]|jgi:Kef-type K+ transport system membrane component KefB|uniref:Transporter, CPA2 family n=1 Tax=Paramaledivibacter caminithermalis (strain DSM 15212 / CIP 107654 / DViRD3) TaxID=1121301 RepID=A0A1M6L248_PARC5|nr:cation:proton antiporter [Paramaledivibacter caminithermalis]SHJ65301.1 transporter, CPA2 family [Paramaledivibacter caminithermalis DSM 15212]